MPRVLKSSVNFGLIILATLLSAFNGFLSILAVLVFTGHERAGLFVSIYLPAALWFFSLACFWLPKSGFTVYVVILVTSILFCVNPMHQENPAAAWYQCSYDLRFAIIGGVLLLANLFVPRDASS